MKINGLRNKIVHDYGSIQLDTIYDTVKNNLPDSSLTGSNSTRLKFSLFKISHRSINIQH